LYILLEWLVELQLLLQGQGQAVPPITAESRSAHLPTHGGHFCAQLCIGKIPKRRKEQKRRFQEDVGQ
jgi:hypothetical protein